MAGVNPVAQRQGLMDQVLKGLQIADTVFGIKSAMDESDYRDEQRTKAEELEKQKASGAKTAGEVQELKLLHGFQDAKEGEEGATELALLGGGKTWVKKTPALKPPTTEKVGETLLTYNPKTGKWDESYKGQPKPKEQEVITVETVDDKGNPITKLVPKVAGGSYPKPPKTDGDGKPPTADQSKAALFAKRMEQAEGVFTALTDGGYNRADASEGIQSSRFFPDRLQGENYKKQQQAEDNFLNAVLRRESGASISDEERATGSRQYFPRSGDTAEVLEQKRQNRELAISGLNAEAGDRALAAVKMPAAKGKKEDTVGKAFAGPQGGGKPKTVIQNGHTYTLNEKTGEYE